MAIKQVHADNEVRTTWTQADCNVKRQDKAQVAGKDCPLCDSQLPHVHHVVTTSRHLDPIKAKAVLAAWHRRDGKASCGAMAIRYARLAGELEAAVKADKDFRRRADRQETRQDKVNARPFWCPEGKRYGQPSQCGRCPGC